MRRVTGIGGIFFLSPAAKRLRAWYGKHLGLALNDWGSCVFEWREKDAPRRVGATAWSIKDATSTYFAPSRERFMVNYRVENLDAMLAALKREGVKVDAKREDSEFGRFAWIYDPEGRKLELWQPAEEPAPKRKSKKKSAARRRA